MREKFIIFLTIVAVALIFAGCSGDFLNLKIRFDSLNGLKENDRLVFDGNHVGDVKKVAYTKEGDYVVDVSVKKGFANAATEYSKFYVESDPAPDKRPNKAIVIELDKKGGKPLKDGSEVRGSSKNFLGTLFDSVENKADRLKNRIDETFGQLQKEIGDESGKIMRDLEKSIDGIAGQLDKFAGEIREMPNSDEIRGLERDMEKFARELDESANSVKEKIKKDIIPKLQDELESLCDRLEKFGRQEEVAPLKRKMDKIKEI